VNGETGVNKTISKILRNAGDWAGGERSKKRRRSSEYRFNIIGHEIDLMVNIIIMVQKNS